MSPSGQVETQAEAEAQPGRPSALLINIHARRGRHAAKVLPGLLRGNGLTLDSLSRIKRPGDLRGEAATLVAKGFGRILVAGGDGTIATVASALAGTGVLLGVLPLGTANDFARSLAIPDDLRQAARIAAGGHFRAIDLGRANGHAFLNVASVGLSVAARKALRGEEKRRFGPFAYAIAGARTLASHRTFVARIEAEEGPVETEAHQIVVGNGRFYGGGVLVDPSSTLDDGLLSAYALGSRGRWELLRTMVLLRMGVPIQSPGDGFLRTRRLRLSTERPLPVNLDGEIRTSTPVDFSVDPGALRVLTPRPASAG